MTGQRGVISELEGEKGKKGRGDGGKSSHLGRAWKTQDPLQRGGERRIRGNGKVSSMGSETRRTDACFLRDCKRHGRRVWERKSGF